LHDGLPEGLANGPRDDTAEAAFQPPDLPPR